MALKIARLPTKQPSKLGLWGWVIVFNRSAAILFVVAGCFHFNLSADEFEFTELPWPECNDTFCLEVLPAVCVTAEAEAKCEQPLLIRWQSHRMRKPCIYQDNALLHCWEGARAGEWMGTIEWPKEGSISLTDESGAIVAEAEISVQSLKPRRRLGSPWSVF